MGLSRKEFLLSSVGLIGLYGGLSRNGFSKFFASNTLGATRMSMLYDSSRCIGCKMCEKGCTKENNASVITVSGEPGCDDFMKIKSIKNSDGKSMFLKSQCLHCTEASCESVCPTGAAAHNGEYVVIDQDVCIGCGYCVESCPFGIPHREPEEAAHKCTFCIEKIKEGKEPACANACPNNATVFGPRDDLLIAAKTRVDTLNKTGYPEAQLYGEDKLGGLNVLYILQKSPSFYGLPENPKAATKNLLAQWTSGSLTAAALIVPFWYFYKRRQKKDQQTDDEEENVG